ncbi:MAG: CBS domain-containing protein [Thermoprotei archaeon]
MFEELAAQSIGNYIEDFPVLSGSDPVYEALGVFQKLELMSFPVRLEKGYGVLQAHSILRVKSPDTRIRLFVKRVPELSQSVNVGVAAKIMVENRVQLLPVVEDGKMMGVLRADRVLSGIVKREAKGLSVKDIMTPHPITVDAGDTLGKAVRLLTTSKVDHLPVSSKGKVTGVVTSKSVLLLLLSPGEKLTHGVWGLEALSQKRVPVGGIAQSVISSEVNEGYLEALKRVLESKSTYTLVVFGEELQGIATLRDFLKPLAEYQTTVALPIQVSGLGDDLLTDGAIKQKLKRLALFASKSIPSVFEIEARIKRVGPTGKTFQVNVQFYTPKKTINITDTGYDVFKVFDSIEKRLKQSIKQEINPPRKRFPKRMQ